MAGVDIVLEEADKLLEEEGLVSCPVPVEIPRGHEEPLVPASFTAQAKGFLTELRAMEHSTCKLLEHAQTYNLEGVLIVATALAQFMRTDCHTDSGLLKQSNYSQEEIASAWTNCTIISQTQVTSSPLMASLAAIETAFQSIFVEA